MDKNSEINAIIERNGEQVHTLPSSQMREIHRKSGIWIFNWAKGLHGVRKTPGGGQTRYFEFYCISHLRAGRGYYRAQGMDKSIEVCPGQCIFVSPGARQWYGGEDGGDFVEDTVNFLGENADRLRESGVFADGVHELGDEAFLEKIIGYASDPSDHGQLNAGFALERLVQNVYNDEYVRRTREKYPELTRLMEFLRDGTAWDWKIERMADFCRLGVSAFREQFRKRTGMLPKIYVDRVRVNLSCVYLRGTGMDIQEIAQKSGYADPFHFTRRFTALTGMSPSEYRMRCRRITDEPK